MSVIGWIVLGICLAIIVALLIFIYLIKRSIDKTIDLAMKSVIVPGAAHFLGIVIGRRK